MHLLVTPCGSARCLYGEEVDLHALGAIEIARGSHVDPDETGNWWADLSPVHGPRLGPFRHRTGALQAERDWLEANWLLRPE